MINRKHIAVADIDTYLFKHIPSGLHFSVDRNNLEHYLKDLEPLPEGKCINALTDVTITVRYQFTEWEIKPVCPGQVEQLMDILKKANNLELPVLTVSLDFFKAAYGMKEEQTPILHTVYDPELVQSITKSLFPEPLTDPAQLETQGDKDKAYFINGDMWIWSKEPENKWVNVGDPSGHRVTPRINS